MNIKAHIGRWINYVAESRYALWLIGGISFIESIFFPIPPDVFIVPLVAQKKYTWIQVGAVAAVGATLGALLAYGIGYFFYDQFAGVLHLSDSSGLLGQISGIYDKYGFFAVVLAAFTPVPDKLFTFGSGFLKFALLPYLIAYTIGKGARMFLFAYIGEMYGQAVAEKSLKKITFITIGVGVIIAILIFLGTLLS
ncbi:MAG TPA: YqaA family protein [Candidatus Paceibacterota bacterium]